MDGLDDRLGGLHKRLDDLDNRLDRHEMRLDAMPTSVGTPIKERIDGVERMVREQLDATARAMDETAEGMRNLLGDTSVGLHRRLEDLAGRPAVDPTEPLGGSIAQRLEATRGAGCDAIDEGMSGRLGTLGGRWTTGSTKLESAVASGRTAAPSTALSSGRTQESERRNAGQLDEAMATFAELILGRGARRSSPRRRRPRPRRSAARQGQVVQRRVGRAHRAGHGRPDD